MNNLSPDPAPQGTILTGDALQILNAVGNKSCSLLITSPPYNIGKIYEREKKRDINSYVDWVSPIFKLAIEKIADDGHLCLQVGAHLRNSEVFPLDYYFYKMLFDHGMKLRNRIIWRFNFGLNAKKRFSGRYETLLWFSKSENYKFNLDPVRIPQIYPGKRHSSKKPGKAGQPSGNPLGKNPSDFWEFSANEHFNTEPVWDIPNVKANHPEKTQHPCQFPVELAERCVLALTDPGDIILDPFAGVGTSVVAALKHDRNGIGIEIDEGYAQVGRERITLLRNGELNLRPIGKPVRLPRATEAVSTAPIEWKQLLTE
ncbi:site-specific DNA-methyltransferase [Mesorhizobium sp. M0078]|uniref:DNA-methyltransferase n=1 Tax=Mesorhizobium sp. M0078 TaxID=2956871 RepID=UPI00333CE710